MARPRAPTLAVIEDHWMLSKQRPSREGSNPAWGSHPSLSSQELIQLALSAGNTTPTAENTPSHRGVSGYPLSHSFSSMPHDDVFYDSAEAKDDTLDISQLTAKTQPITITGRKRNTSEFGGVEALSARGDLQGGYFPLHEDHGPNVYYPHPFYEDTARARRLSIQHASKEALLSSASLDHKWRPSIMSSESEFPQLDIACSPGSPDTMTSTIASSHVPVSSYLPTGVHGYAALPTGKYYPTNWERLHQTGSSSRQGQQQMDMARSAPGHHRPPHKRNVSDTKPRLIQYRRDMIIQATVVGSNMAQSSDSKAGLGALLKSHKPQSPRLAPLGSPGPVTPMNLEGATGSDSYLMLDRTMTESNATQH